MSKRLEMRSRRGCEQCRAVHLKCDERSPRCGRCQTRRLGCEYVKRTKWTNMSPDTIAIVATSQPNPRSPVVRTRTHTTPVMPTARYRGDHEQSHHISPDNQMTRTTPIPPALASLPPPPDTPPPIFERAEDIAAYQYYIDRLAGELQAEDGLDNPYRKLSSMALGFPVLMRTILSCAAEHMHVGGHWPIQRAIDLHDGAIRLLRSKLADWRPAPPPSCDGENSSSRSGGGGRGEQLSADQAIIAAMLLQPAAIAFGGGSVVDAEAHMDMASYGLGQLGYIGQPGMASQQLIPRLLVQRFAMVDTCLGIYSRRRPRLPLHSWFAQSSATFDVAEPSFRRMTGCPHAVFVFLLRVCHLAADLAEDGELEEGSTGRDELFHKALLLESEMRLYDSMGSSSGEQDTQVGLIARAFINIALLLLMRRVLGEEAGHPRVQHAVKVIFTLMQTMQTQREAASPLGAAAGSSPSSIDSATGLPFYLAAREAVTSNDQAWARELHDTWRRIYINPARARLMETAEEIWALRARGGHNDACQAIEENCKAYIF